MIADLVIHSFLPISLSDGDLIGGIFILLVMAIVLTGPFVSSVYLADPFTSSRRHFSIAAIIIIVFALDISALGLEWFAAQIAN